MWELAGTILLLALGWSWHHTTGLLLTAIGLLAAWFISRLLWPYKPCPRCKGSGRNPGSNSRRHGDCKRCKGTRRIRRFGARHVHWVKLSILGRIRER